MEEYAVETDQNCEGVCGDVVDRAKPSELKKKVCGEPWSAATVAGAVAWVVFRTGLFVYDCSLGPIVKKFSSREVPYDPVYG